MSKRLEPPPKKVGAWLEACPFPCIARVVDEYEDILHIASTTFAYTPGCLVVVPVEILGKVVYREKDDDSG